MEQSATEWVKEPARLGFQPTVPGLGADRNHAGWRQPACTLRRGDDAPASARVAWAALLALPVVVVASVAIGAPLAGPAAVSLGYLAVARAVMKEDGRSTATW